MSNCVTTGLHGPIWRWTTVDDENALTCTDDQTELMLRLLRDEEVVVIASSGPQRDARLRAAAGDTTYSAPPLRLNALGAGKY